MAVLGTVRHGDAKGNASGDGAPVSTLLTRRQRLKHVVKPASRPASILKRAVIRFDRHGGFVMAGYMAYMSVLSLFPFVILLLAIAGLFGQTEQGRQLASYGLEQLPPEVAKVLAKPIYEVMAQSNGGVLTFGILGTLWTAASGLEAARTILNRAYGVECGAPFWRTRLQSMAIMAAVSVGIGVAMSLLVVGPVIWKAVQSYIAIPILWELVWTGLRYSVSAILIFVTISGLYYILPQRKLKARWVFPGAVMTVMLWLLLGTLFSLYLAHFGNYSVTYGSLGGVMVAMLFFYVVGIIFIFGAELNAAIAEADGVTVSQHRS